MFLELRAFPALLVVHAKEERSVCGPHKHLVIPRVLGLCMEWRKTRLERTQDADGSAPL